MDFADYAALTATLRDELLAFVSAAWEVVSLDDDGLEEFVGTVVPVVQASQLQMAAATSVYFSEATGGTAAAVSDGVITTLRGVSPEVVYSRPIATARTALSRGKSVSQALASGGRRAENIASTDLQMAKVHQAHESLQASEATLFRRVPTGRENCAMCMIAATQPYKKKDLMPIHPGCDCDVDIIPAGMDLNDMFDADAILEATHARVEEFAGLADRGGRAVDYRKLIVTHEHGEVGPVIAWKGQKFTGPADLAN